MRRPLVSKNTGFSRSKASVALLLLIGGCATPTEVKVAEGNGENGSTIETARFDPNVDDPNDLYLLNGSAKLRLGVKRERALTVFPPPKDSAAVASLPAKFGRDFGVAGWQTENEGFAFITMTVRDPESKKTLYRDLLVMAMLQEENVSEGAAQETEAIYKEEFGEPTDKVLDGGVSYLFWAKQTRLLMLMTSMDPHGVRSQTIAVGAPQVMSELGMTPSQAKIDARAANETSVPPSKA